MFTLSLKLNMIMNEMTSNMNDERDEFSSDFGKGEGDGRTYVNVCFSIFKVRPRTSIRGHVRWLVGL